MSKTTTIRLGGFMAEKYAEEVTLAGNSIKELMRGLKHRFGHKFTNDIAANDWHLVKGKDLESGVEMDESDLPYRLNTEVLYLIPVISAAKRFIKIIIGIVLLVAAAYGYGNAQTVALGWSMIIGGVIDIVFAPKPLGARNNSSDDQEGSYVFNGAVNITSQGGLKPLLVGRVRRSASVVISSDFSTDRIAQNYIDGAPSTDESYDTSFYDGGGTGG